jgi:hypothetical protein
LFCVLKHRIFKFIFWWKRNRPPAKDRAASKPTTPRAGLGVARGALNRWRRSFEQRMHDCGLYSVEDMRPINGEDRRLFGTDPRYRAGP